MLRSASPTKFLLAWAANAGGSFIRTVPIASQIGVNAGAASYNDGFVPDNFTQIAAGGVPPFGQDMNGILNETTAWDQWYQAGGPIFYDSAFAAAIGGYPQGAVVMSAVVLGNYWLSTVDNNATDPDSSGAANWISPPGLLGTGALGKTVFTTLPSGWVWAKNAYTIGNAASGASYAAANAIFLYTALWIGFPNSQCPVTGGRGANPAADFAAGKPIQVLDIAGSGIIGVDNSTGRLTSVPVISGNPNVPGCLLGENLHTITVGETAQHTHSGSTNTESTLHTHTYGTFTGATIGGGGAFGPLATATTTNTSSQSPFHTHTFITDGGTGGAGPHNTVHRSMGVGWLLKL